MALSTLLVIILLACAYEVYRSDKSYRKRLEIETDANILWSKENAAKLQEPATILNNSAAAAHISLVSIFFSFLKKIQFQNVFFLESPR